MDKRANYLFAIKRRGFWRKIYTYKLLLWSACLLILAVTLLGSKYAFFSQTDVDRGLQALTDAYKRQRPFEARLTLFAYAPLLNSRGNEANSLDQATRNRAGLLLLEGDNANQTAKSRHALGLYYLTERQFDQAIELFEAALKLEPNDSLIHSDLGAGYLQRVVSKSDKPSISDLAKSLEHLNRAIEIDDSISAAYFNKALCLQRMNVPSLVKQSWEDYLKRDLNSGWSKEAEKNLLLAQAQSPENRTPETVFDDFLAAYRQRDEAQAWRIQSQTKEMITGIMLPFQLARKSIEATLSNKTEAGKEILDAFRFAGELEKIHSGDPFFAELAAFYSVAGKKNAAKLKQAQDAVESGYQLCLQGHYSPAIPLFEDAQRLFLEAGDTWESKVIDYWLAYCLCQQGELKRSSKLLSALAEYCRRLHYSWLEAQSYSWLAINSAVLGEYFQGIEYDKKALDIALAIGDLYSTQKIASQLTRSHNFFGRFDEALEFNRLSLPSPDDYFVSHRQYWRSLNSLAGILFAIRLYAAAEAYEREALELATNEFKDPVLIHNTYVRLGQIYSGQQHYAAAEQSFEMSLEAIKMIEGDLSTRKLLGQSALYMGNLKRISGDYDASLNHYRRALQMFDSTDSGLFNYLTRKGMLQCYLLNKDDAAVRQELPAVLSLFEDNRQKIKEEQIRNHFFDAEQDIYDLVIDYEYNCQNIQESFNYAELSRARSLLYQISPGMTDVNKPSPTVLADTVASQPLTLTGLQKHLPADLQLVEFAVLQNRLLIWVITWARFETIELQIPASALEAVMTEYLRVLPRSDDDSIRRERELAAELYDWLFAPLEGYLNKEEELVLVPDKFLFKVPFAALLSRQTDRRVVEDYSLLCSPSATISVLCSNLALKKSTSKEAEKVLSVGDPKFNKQRYPSLPRLPMAATEARTIAFLYSARALFVHDEAIKKEIEPKLDWADVIHFATHYHADDYSPAKSRLVLADRGGASMSDRSSDLSMEEIQTRRLARAKLVVLAACQSGIERYYAGEGLIGLSRAFIIAGVPLVIASQWKVDSDPTAQLMIDFHQYRKTRHLSTTQALRLAQISMMNHEDERYRQPYYWAGFFPIGGHVKY